jgi:hypothetical protein
MMPPDCYDLMTMRDGRAAGGRGTSPPGDGSNQGRQIHRFYREKIAFSQFFDI